MGCAHVLRPLKNMDRAFFLNVFELGANNQWKLGTLS